MHSSRSRQNRIMKHIGHLIHIEPHIIQKIHSFQCTPQCVNYTLNAIYRFGIEWLIYYLLKRAALTSEYKCPCMPIDAEFVKLIFLGYICLCLYLGAKLVNNCTSTKLQNWAQTSVSWCQFRPIHKSTNIQRILKKLHTQTHLTIVVCVPRDVAV